MSISFNHPKNTVTSTGSLNLTVTGGNVSTPQPIRFNSTSVIMPVRALPAGEAGAMVFDTGTKTMKYHDGLNWVEILSQDEILEPIYVQINRINQVLGTKVDNVVYNVGTVPQASISGTQLNITFPPSSSTGQAANGLFTSSKKGAIQYYALTSGMTAATIREQMSGVTGGQAGRNGTQAAPWITNDGWAFADGMWWTWLGESGTVTQQVSNLNQQAYLKPMVVSGTTQITSVIAASASIGGTALSIAQLPSHQFTVSGQTSTGGNHNHGMSDLWSARMSIDDVRVGVFRQGHSGYPSGETTYNGDHFHTFTGTSNVIGSNQTHTHNVESLDVAHFNVAVLYNIATPSYALNEVAANGKYVLKTGDVMTGSLTMATAAVVRGNDTNVTFSFRNTNNTERAMIYHSSTTNTLRMRAAGGSELTLDSTGILNTNSLRGTSLVVSTSSVSSQTSTVGGKNVVRSVNGTEADGTGNVNLPTAAYVSGVRIIGRTTAGVSESPVIQGTVMTGWAYGDKKELRGATYYYGYLQYLINGTWTTISYQ